MSAPLVELRRISKRFGSVAANRAIDLDLMAGEVHALLGANGAGKSTLMSILAGAYRPDSGSIRIRGRGMRFRRPADALAAGIGMVYQHFRLVGSMTVAENLALGDPALPWYAPPQLLLDRAGRAADELGFPIRPGARIQELSVAECQRVEILRNLARGVEVLILDEPTASLTPQEAESLFEGIRRLRQAGRAILFISHKLEEVLELADRITVLRDGRRIRTVPAGEVSQPELVSWLLGTTEVGRESVESSPPPRREGPPRLHLEEITLHGSRGETVLSDLSLRVWPGEILGVAGLAGEGQRELAEVITGLRRPSRGRIWLDQHRMEGRSAREHRRGGVRFIPSDRNRRGLVGDLTVAENAVLTWLDHPDLGGRPWLSRRRIRRFGQDLIRSHRIEPPDPDRPTRLLSGGNLQKLILARETRDPAGLIVAAYPLRGLDVGATRFIMDRLRQEARRGAAVILMTEDLEHLLELSDRLVVLVRGRLVAECSPRGMEPADLGLIMTGQEATR